jgi:serine/threonine-protein kinase RIM15
MADTAPHTLSVDPPTPLLAPAISNLRKEGGLELPYKGRMERTLSEDIREQREDLKEAAEHAHTVVVELSTDGIVRWASPSWVEVVGTTLQDVIGQPIASLLVSDTTTFEKATEDIRKDDSRSQNIRFSVLAGPGSTLRKKSSRRKDETVSEGNECEDQQEEMVIDLEGQGIMVYDRSTGKESHVSGVV